MTALKRHSDSLGSYDHDQDLYVVHYRPGVPGRGVACLLDPSLSALDASLLARLRADQNPVLVGFRHFLRLVVISVSFPFYLVGYVLPNWIGQTMNTLVELLKPPVLRWVERIARPIRRGLARLERGYTQGVQFIERKISQVVAIGMHYGKQEVDRLTIVFTIVIGKIRTWLEKLLAPIARALMAVSQRLGERYERLQFLIQKQLEQLQKRLEVLHERALFRAQRMSGYWEAGRVKIALPSHNAHFAAWIRVIPRYVLHLVNESLNEVMRWFK